MLFLKLPDLLHFFTSRRGALEFEPEPADTSTPFLDLLPVLTERIEPVAGLRDCRLRVGYFLAGQRAFRVRPALPNVRTAAALRDVAQRELRARTARTHHHATGPRATGATSSEPALVQYDSEAARLPPARVYPRPDPVQLGPIGRTLVPLLAVSVPRSRRLSVSRHRVSTRHSWWLTGCQSHVSTPARNISTPITHMVSFAPSKSVPHGSQAVVNPC